MKISHSRVHLEKNTVQAASKVLESGMIAQGQKVTEFEKQVASSVNQKFALAVNSGTSALHLSLLALGITSGDEVIIPSYTCTALLNAVLYTGATPVIVDVNSDTLNIDSPVIKQHLTRKTKAIIVPHMFGRTADIKNILKLGTPIIEDCAQAIGATIDGKPVGSFGTLSVFSFYATKVMTTGEGGMVAASNRTLYQKIKDLRDYDQKPNFKIRFNYKMTDFQAAMGIDQLKQLPNFLKIRRQIANKYTAALNPDNLLNPDPGQIFLRYIIKLTPTQKPKFIKHMKAAGIDCREPVYKPLHKYIKKFICPNADKLMQSAVSIPIFPDLKPKEIKYLITKTQNFLL